MRSIDKLLTGLNKNQKKAVMDTDGPSLIVAGAGSGKTKVLTTKLAYIISERKAWSNQILCVTFTNKAAREMQNRILTNLKKESGSLPWLGTFHSISVKILRRHAEALDYKSNFTILDTDDQKKLIKKILESENIDLKKVSPRFVISFIDKWKNKGLLPDDINLDKSKTLENTIKKIYSLYQSKTKDLNAFDFGDLILFCVKLFENDKSIKKIYNNNFKYILVDEFQDTNFIQNKWLNLLVNEKQNICCVGDDDQSIYSWRGAEIKNFLTFDKIYPKCKIYKLEQNYRSTKNILKAASVLISNNENRVGKKLWSDGEDGELLKLNCYRTGREEAEGVADLIENNLKKKYSLNNISILLRAIYQTREFEERFLKVGINYRVLGGIKFYERAEIKDAVAYLRIVNQKFDDLALERVLSTPKKGIGSSTLNQIYEYSNRNKLCLEDSIIKIIELNKFKPKIKNTLNSFINLIHKWRRELKHLKHYDLLKLILDESGYSLILKNKKDLENENRLENLKELIRAMRDYENLNGFLEHVALATSVDQNWEGEKINLMTMHAAKGLEFDVTFLPGWEEGLFPHQKSLEEKGDFALEEERRLAYVAITRAKKESFISFAMKRSYQGDWMDSLPSRFVNELPDVNVEKNENIEKSNFDEFDINQDLLIDEESDYRSPGWERFKNKKMLKWKK
ncbi:MAG: DNA helicase II [Candidatus Pelagibacter sp.]|mgnify:CR=1 FL=1|nr:DNA helicase II [Candidatus Pelagibacter sp.]OUW24231.1 MAG: DNA helicase II [Rickettsiales bacterium TMED174]